MDIRNHIAVVTGAASGLGEATARHLAAQGAHVALLDRNAAALHAVARDMGGQAHVCDITSEAEVTACLDALQATWGTPRILMNIAGIGTAQRTIGKAGQAAPLQAFEQVVRVNLVGTYNVTRLFAARCVQLPALEDGLRGVVVMTASVAAFEGQIGQQAYSASKAGIAGMTLPMARDLASFGIRVCTIAPGLFATPLVQALPSDIQSALAQSIPFPKRLGQPAEFAQLAAHIVHNDHLNGEVIRLDGALRMAPR